MITLAAASRLRAIISMCAAILVIMPLGATAQEMPSVFVRDVVLADASYAPGDIVRGTALLVNETSYALTDVRYVTTFVGGFSADGIPSTEFAATTSGPLYLGAGASREIAFAIPVPAGVAGDDLGVDVQAMLGDGTPLGWSDARISIAGTSRLLTIDAATLQVNDASFAPTSGPTIRAGDTVSLKLTVSGAQDAMRLVPHVAVYDRTVGTGAMLSEMDLPAFDIAPGTAQTIELALPVFEYRPGVYAGTVSLRDSAGIDHLQTLTFRYIGWGASAVIHAVTTDTHDVAAGDTAGITVTFAGPSEDIATGETVSLGSGTITAELYDRRGARIGMGATSADLDAVTQVRVPVGISAASAGFRAHVTISHADSVLATEDATFESEMAASDREAFLAPELIYAGLSVIVGLAILMILGMLYRYSKRFGTAAAVALFALASLAGMPSAAAAYTVTENPWKPDSVPGWPMAALKRGKVIMHKGTRVFVNAPSGTLAPGQQFHISGYVDSEKCSNTPQRLYVEGVFNGQKKTFARTIQASGGEVHTHVTDRFSFGPFTAPTTPGTYRVYVGGIRTAGPMANGDYYTSGQYGYQEFTVPAPRDTDTTPPGGGGGGGGTRTTTPTSCPTGYMLQGGSCVRRTCPTGYVVQAGVCVPLVCPAGYIPQGDACVVDDSALGCRIAPICSDGTHVQDRCTGDIVACPSRWSCVGGQCIAPRPAEGTIKASPSIVRAGTNTSIIWSSTNTVSCAVTENDATNDDRWTGVSGTQTTGTMVQPTIYTLTCTGLDGGQLVREAQVSIIPVWNER